MSTPRATLLPASATNRPLLAAARTAQPVNLATSGYVEEELLVSGVASSPYVTRMLLRRPAQSPKFSGRVIVELLDAANGYDTAPLWGMSSAYFLRRGDVWVGVSIAPAAQNALQRFDAVRYASLSGVTAQASACAPAAGVDQVSGIIAQIGALLRSASRENPLHTYRAQRFIAAGYGAAGTILVSYAHSAHGAWRLGDGAPIFDAYLNAANDERAAGDACVTPRDVPFITVLTESQLPLASSQGRASNDAQSERYRRYDIAGAAHDGAFSAGLPASADLTIAGIAAPDADACVERRNDFPAGLAFNAIWQQFDDLLVRGQAMASALVFETDAAGAIARDASGNALGGWRLPQIEVPIARYAGRGAARASHSHSQSLCEHRGATQSFDAAQLKLMYRDRAQFLRRFDVAVDQAVTNRLLLREDADALKNPAARVLPAF